MGLFIAATPPPAFDPDAIILWTFAAAALVFFVSWGVRMALGKFERIEESPAAPKRSAEDAALYVPAATSPPPLPRTDADSPYAPPGSVPRRFRSPWRRPLRAF